MSSADSWPCHLQEFGSAPRHCQVTEFPSSSNKRCRQCQHQLLEDESDAVCQFQVNWFLQLVFWFFHSFLSCAFSTLSPGGTMSTCSRLPAWSCLLWPKTLWRRLLWGWRLWVSEGAWWFSFLDWRLPSWLRWWCLCLCRLWWCECRPLGLGSVSTSFSSAILVMLSHITLISDSCKTEAYVKYKTLYLINIVGKY